MKKAAERNAVRWGWVFLAALFFFGAAVVLELSSFVPTAKTPDAVGERILQMRLERDLLGANTAQPILSVQSSDTDAETEASFLEALAGFLNNEEAQSDLALPNPKGEQAVQQMRERLSSFSYPGLDMRSPVRIALQTAGETVWNSWQDSRFDKLQGIDVFSGEERFPVSTAEIQDSADAALRQVGTDLQLQCCLMRSDSNTLTHDLVQGDVYSRVMAIMQIVSGEVGRLTLRTEFVLFLILTILCTWLALWGAMREGGRVRDAKRLIDQLPLDLYAACVLPAVVFLVWQMQTGQYNVDKIFVRMYGGAADVFALIWKPLIETGVFFAIIGELLLMAFSVRRGGIRYAFAFFRYEKVAFSHRTIYYLLLIEAVKILALSLFLSGTLPRDGQNGLPALLTADAQTSRFVMLLLFLLLEKLVLLPVLLRCVREMRAVMENTAKYAGGDLSGLERGKDKGLYRSFARHQQDVDSIARRIRDTADEFVQGSKFKAELVTNLSHDIKTPLTSIINYAQLLRDPRLDAEEKGHYLQVLQRHADRLTKLVEDLTDVSDAAAGNIHVEMTSLDLCMAVRQSALGFEERLAARGITMRFYTPNKPVYVHADSRLLWRVMDNLMNNICKYAKPESIVKIAVVEHDRTALAVYRNISETSLANTTGDALMERFVRGDVSRHTEGSGLGLSIARSLMGLQEGSLTLQTDKELFTAQVTLQKLTD